MSKCLLVSEKLVCDVMKLIIYLEYNLDYGDLAEIKHLCAGIKTEISEKFERAERRKAFTAYKTATHGQERESLRRAYIELAHMRKSFTSSNEVPYHLLS